MLDQQVYSIRPGRGRMPANQLIRDLDDFVLRTYSISDVKAISVSEDVGILSYRFRWSGAVNGKDFTGPPVYSTSVWALRKGQWMSILYQETPLDE